MKTRPTDDPQRDTCDIERVDDLNATYLCCQAARTIWEPIPGTCVHLCSPCRKWLETMESLGLKLN